jgi:hypothetical protein
MRPRGVALPATNPLSPRGGFRHSAR